jgi:hypothetical protein
MQSLDRASATPDDVLNFWFPEDGHYADFYTHGMRMSSSGRCRSLLDHLIQNYNPDRRNAMRLWGTPRSGLRPGSRRMPCAPKKETPTRAQSC